MRNNQKPLRNPPADGYLSATSLMSTESVKHMAARAAWSKPMSKPSITTRSVRLVGLLLIALTGVLPALAQNPWKRLPDTPELPKPERSGTAPVNGIRMWYAEFGHGSPVILLHGGLANSNYWGLQIPALAPHFEVIVADSRGHGRSTGNSEPITYHLMATDVLALMDALHIPKAALVGWSDGAIIGLEIAIHHPERLTKLFAFGANSNVSGVRNSEGSVTIAAYQNRTRDEYRRFSPAPAEFNAFLEGLKKMWTTEPNFSDAQLRRITTPTWIVDGDRDEIIKREDTDHMASLIPGAGELILPSTSHFAFLQDPKQFNEALLHFLLGP
ncbi:MAG TPA: alpha/beta hydrolase [Terriglobia bacterium]|nr:alpha/beta hydrolase [Terriglobia bacterium]